MATIAAAGCDDGAAESPGGGGDRATGGTDTGGSGGGGGSGGSGGAGSGGGSGGATGGMGGDGTDPVPPTVSLTLLGQYSANEFDAGGAEIVEFHAASKRAFVVNAFSQRVDILDLTNPASPTKLGDVDVAADLVTLDAIDAAVDVGSANSVAINGSRLAVAVEAAEKTDPGFVIVYTIGAGPSFTLTPAGAVHVGALPDMVTFTPNGEKLLVANEGEGNDDYSVDPEGSISIITLPAALVELDQGDVRTAGFSDFNAGGTKSLTGDVRIFGIHQNGTRATVAEDLEPEYITVSADGSRAYVTLQDNNALAVVDVNAGSVLSVTGLGTIDRLEEGFEFDPTDEDEEAALGAWPVYSLFQPDTIASYSVGGETYLITANEGDTRDDDLYGDVYNERIRVKDLGDLTTAVDDLGFDLGGTWNNEALAEDTALGRLRITSTMGYPAACDQWGTVNVDGSGIPVRYDTTPGDCQLEKLYTFGARSFSIWGTDGTLVWDSGNLFEELTAELAGVEFNADNTENGVDARSDDKGPEPEALAVGELGGRHYAFVGLERTGGVFVIDITDPTAGEFMSYTNARNFSVEPEVDPHTPSGPESIRFIPAASSPNGKPLLLVGNEISGTTLVYEIVSE